MKSNGKKLGVTFFILHILALGGGFTLRKSDF